MALKVFRYQFENNIVYREFCGHLNKSPENVKSTIEIPFLPIEFFKSHDVVSGNGSPRMTFTSSTTTGSIPSRHIISDLTWYEASFKKAFSLFYGDVANYAILALLPSYQERTGSSLIYMVNDLVYSSENEHSGFYLYNLDELSEKVSRLDSDGESILLIGVSYALLDLIESQKFSLQNTIIMETGGMKGRRKEMIRDELHYELTKGFGVGQIHSEYGMTELLSQAYSLGNGRFECPPWMDICIRDPEDAMTIFTVSKNGGINVIDLANINSCSFIATQDLGRKYPDDSFEVLGRFDHSDVRGCNLMAL